MALSIDLSLCTNCKQSLPLSESEQVIRYMPEAIDVDDVYKHATLITTRSLRKITFKLTN